MDKLLADVLEAELQRALARQAVPAIDGPQDIARLRRATGLTQAAFAKALGVSVDTYRNWEQGRRRPHGSGRALLARGPR